jgi:hypothetical protein
VVPQGGAWLWAEQGLAELAREIDILVLQDQHIGHEQAHVSDQRGELPILVLPSGTGTTAYFLARHLQNLQVAAVPCVGGEQEFRKQVDRLHHQKVTSQPDTPQVNTHILIVQPPAGSDASFCIPRFAGLSCDVYNAWHELSHCNGINVDLIYGACAWATIFQMWEEAEIIDINSDHKAQIVERSLETGREYYQEKVSHHAQGQDQLSGCTYAHVSLQKFAERDQPLYYLNCGGLEGIPSQLARYVQKGIATENDAAATLLLMRQAS